MITSGVQGRTVLLTGALGSLGRAQAVLFAGEKAQLLLLDRPEMKDAGEAFAREIGGDARYVGIDLGEVNAAAQAVAALAEAMPIDILVNNAATIINRPFEEFSIEEYDEQVRVNSTAVFALVQALAPPMKTRRYGKIVNFCSLVLNGRWDGYVPYTASKGAVLGLTKTLARELGAHGIRVNAISPGAVVSEAEARVFGNRLQAYNDWILENQCLKERIQPEAVARLVLFLAGPGSDMISGQNIHIDGGW